MPQILEVIGPKSGAAPLQYKLTELGTVDLMSIFARFDGSAASGDWRPTVTIRAQNGTILARIPVDETLPTGDTADVTFAPFLRGAAAAAAAGIQFDTYPQAGGYLYVETTGGSIDINDFTPGGAFVNIYSDEGQIQIYTGSGTGQHISISPGGDFLVFAGSDVGLQCEDVMSFAATTGPIELDAPAIELNSVSVILALLPIVNPGAPAGQLWNNAGVVNIT